MATQVRRHDATLLGVVAACVATATWLAAPPAALAQERSDFAVERYRPTLDDTGILTVEAPRVGKAGALFVGLHLSYANDPFVVTSTDRADNVTRLGSLVEHRAASFLVASYAFADHFQVGVELPVVMYQARPTTLTGSNAMLAPLTKPALSDLRLVAKVALLKTECHCIDVAALASVTLPSGGAYDYLGDGGITVTPELAVGRTFRRAVVAANLSYRFRRNTAAVNLPISDELAVRVAGRYQFVVAKFFRRTWRFDAASSLLFATNASRLWDASANQTPVELLTSVGLAVGNVRVEIGGGLGLVGGFGVPDFRTLASTHYRRQF